jgi:hypothetical protein
MTDAALDALDEDLIDCDYTREIVCPFCGYEHSDSWEHHGNDDTIRMNCEKCEREFDCERDITVHYSSSRIDYEAEAARKAADEKWIADRFIECMRFLPGMRVRIKQGKYDNGSQAGLEGTISEKPPCEHNPFVYVDLDRHAQRRAESTYYHPEHFFPDQVEIIEVP